MSAFGTTRHSYDQSRKSGCAKSIQGPARLDRLGLTEQTGYSSAKTLDERQVPVAPWVIMAYDFKAEPLIELQSLEIVGFEHDLPATPRSGFLLRGAH